MVGQTIWERFYEKTSIVLTDTIPNHMTFLLMRALEKIAGALMARQGTMTASVDSEKKMEQLLQQQALLKRKPTYVPY